MTTDGAIPYQFVFVFKLPTGLKKRETILDCFTYNFFFNDLNFMETYASFHVALIHISSTNQIVVLH